MHLCIAAWIGLEVNAQGDFVFSFIASEKQSLAGLREEKKKDHLINGTLVVIMRSLGGLLLVMLISRVNICMPAWRFLRFYFSACSSCWNSCGLNFSKLRP